MESHDDDLKIPLPNFLKFLTSNNVPVPKAMAIAGKVSVLKQTILHESGLTYYCQLQGIPYSRCTCNTE
jgi:hypothetical protein